MAERSFMDRLMRGIGGFGAGYQGRGPEYLANLRATDEAAALEEAARQQAAANRPQELSMGRRKAAAQDFRNILFDLESGNVSGAQKRINDRLRVGAAMNAVGGVQEFNPETSNTLKRMIDSGRTSEAIDLLREADKLAVRGDYIEAPVRPEPYTDAGKMAADIEAGWVDPNAPQAEPEKRIQSVNSLGSGGLRLFNFTDGSDQLVGGDGQPITDPEARSKAIEQALLADIERRGDISGAEAAATAKAGWIRDNFEQVGQIRANDTVLEEIQTALDNGAKVGILESRFPTWNSATIALRNAGQRLGLGVISSATFGALSEAEMRLAMSTALPQDMDEPALRDWISQRRQAQNKLASELERAIIFFEQGGTPGEWLAQQDQIRIERIKSERDFGDMTEAEIAELLQLEKELGIRP